MTDDKPFILTKIIATIGPASEDVATLVRLLEEGVRVVRVNFSHGSLEDHGRVLGAIRQAAEQTGVPVAVLGDLSGPKIRLGQVQDGGIELNVGDIVHIQRDPITATAPPDTGQEHRTVTFSSTYPALIDEVQTGNRLLVDDGAVRMLVVEKAGQGGAQRLICHVTEGGPVSTAKGINLPDTTLNVASMTEKDVRCLAWAVEHELDFVALSFVRQAADVRDLKARLRPLLKPTGRRMPVIAKIEKPQALGDLEAIVAESDGIMVARGDLGVEMDLAQVPVMQKRIITLSHDFGKPVIVATQMLQSMIQSASPTRAEVSDVANAIFDGADAVMLSGETAVGKFPVQAVRMMARIARITETQVGLDPGNTRRPPRKLQESRYRTAALAHGVIEVVRDLDAKLMVTWSQLGGSARYLSQNRLAVPIIAASSDAGALRQMQVLFAVTPMWMAQPANVEAFAAAIDQQIIARRWAAPGDPYVLVAGEPIGTSGVTNKMRICYVGDVCLIERHQT